MIYQGLPPIGSLPASGSDTIPWAPSPNFSSRGGAAIGLVFVHVWGGGSFDGVVSWLRNPSSQASSHLVYSGETGSSAGKLSQLVAWSEKAWTECYFNPVGVSVESADAIWQGHDPKGFARLARIVALLLHLHGLPARWVRGDAILHSPRGFTRHADGGQLACGHLLCPTSDLELWGQFAERVVLESRHGGFRDRWGR